MCSFLWYIDHLDKYIFETPRYIFETFANNFELTLNSTINKNSFLIVDLGGFHAKITNWYKNNINSYEVLKFDTITFQFGLQQTINEPTYLTSDSSSCIELIFTSQPNLAMESDVHSSLHPNCHHRTIFVKLI